MDQKRNKKWYDLNLILAIVAACVVVYIGAIVYDFKNNIFNNFMLFGILYFSTIFYMRRELFAAKSGFWIPVLAIYYMWNAFLYPVWSFILMIGIFYFILDVNATEPDNNKSKDLAA